MIVQAKIVVDENLEYPSESLYTIVVEDTDFVPPKTVKKSGKPYALANGIYQKYVYSGIEFVCRIES